MTNQSLALIAEDVDGPDEGSTAREARNRLANGVTVQGQIGSKRLFLVPMTLNTGERAILVTVEKESCLVWNGSQRFDQFQLITAGFSILTIPLLLRLLDAIALSPDSHPDSHPNIHPEGNPI